MKKQFYITLLLLAISGILPLPILQKIKAQSTFEMMRANLYVSSNGSDILLDGNLTHFSSTNSNAVDQDDARKMTNPGENFGIYRDGITLVVERRSRFELSDTSFFRIWNLRQQNYMIELLPLNLNYPNAVAHLEDRYLQRNLPVSLTETTKHYFTVNQDPTSLMHDRFRIIYRFVFPEAPVTRITDLRLIPMDGSATWIEWDVADEIRVEKYRLERSDDGSVFYTIREVAPINLGDKTSYSVSDNNCESNPFYRIKGQSLSGGSFYSPVVRFIPPAVKTELSVYPNPVVNKEIQLYLNNPQPGLYQCMLYGAAGELVSKSMLNVNGFGQTMKKINVPHNIKSGVYVIMLIGPENIRLTQKVLIL